MIFDDVLEIKNGRNQKAVENPDGKYPIYGSGGVMGRADDYICDAETVVIGRKGNINKPIFVEEPFWNVDTAFGLEANKSLLLPRYLYYFCVHYDFEKHNKTVTIPSLTKADLLKIQINVPSLAEQKYIVDKLQLIERIIGGRKKELDTLDQLIKARFVEMFGDPKKNNKNLVSIGSIGHLNSGGTPSRGKPEYFQGNIKWFTAGELNSLYLGDTIEHISEDGLKNSSAKLFKKGTLMIGMYDTAAFKMGILTEDSASNQACANLEPNDNYDVIWLYYVFSILKPLYLNERQGVRQQNLSLTKIKNLQFPAAPFDKQKKFADFVREVDKSKVAVQKSLDETQLLFNSLMQKYFG